MVRKFCAIVLVVLAVSPFTAPFGPCLTHHPLDNACGITAQPFPDDINDAGSLIAPIVESARVNKVPDSAMLPLISGLLNPFAGVSSAISTSGASDLDLKYVSEPPSVLRI